MGHTLIIHVEEDASSRRLLPGRIAIIIVVVSNKRRGRRPRLPDDHITITIIAIAIVSVIMLLESSGADSKPQTEAAMLAVPRHWDRAPRQRRRQQRRRRLRPARWVFFSRNGPAIYFCSYTGTQQFSLDKQRAYKYLRRRCAGRHGVCDVGQATRLRVTQSDAGTPQRTARCADSENAGLPTVCAYIYLLIHKYTWYQYILAFRKYLHCCVFIPYYCSCE